MIHVEFLEFDGLEELESAMENALKKYPDLVENTLKKERRNFIKDMKEETWKRVKKHTGNLVKGYKFGPIRTVRGNLESDFYAESRYRGNPHFHLINNGHELVTPVTRKGKKLQNGGQNLGFVPGKRIKEPVIARYEADYPNRMERMFDKICEELEK